MVCIYWHQFDRDFLPVYFQYTKDDDIDGKAYVAGSLTAHKLQTLGTDAAVRESRLTYEMSQGIYRNLRIDAIHLKYMVLYTQQCWPPSTFPG